MELSSSHHLRNIGRGILKFIRHYIYIYIYTYIVSNVGPENLCELRCIQLQVPGNTMENGFNDEGNVFSHLTEVLREGRLIEQLNQTSGLALPFSGC